MFLGRIKIFLQGCTQRVWPHKEVTKHKVTIQRVVAWDTHVHYCLHALYILAKDFHML